MTESDSIMRPLSVHSPYRSDYQKTGVDFCRLLLTAISRASAMRETADAHSVSLQTPERQEVADSIFP